MAAAGGAGAAARGGGGDRGVRGEGAAGGIAEEERRHLRVRVGAAEDDSSVEGGGQNAKRVVLGVLREGGEDELPGKPAGPDGGAAVATDKPPGDL